MPGIAIIGDSRNAARNRPTSLPAEARSLSRMLRLLKAPETASKALSESLATLPLPKDPYQQAALHRVRDQVTLTIEDMKEDGWNISNRYPEYHLALAVEAVLQDSSSFQDPNQCCSSERTTPAASPGHDNSSSSSSSSESTSNIVPTSSTRANKMMGSTSDSVSSLESPGKGAPNTTRTPRRNRRVAVVSDASSVEEDSLTAVAGAQEVTDIQVEEDATDEIVAKSARNLWALILESVHLQVASRTTTVWGRKKIYEIYQLARPVQDLAMKEESLIRKNLELESRSVFEGIFLDDCHCRVYTTFQPLESFDGNIQALHVQINLGKIFDLQDESNRAPSGEKKKKNEGEFVAILVPGSSLFALTASRAASRSRYTPYVLALLENVLTETTNNCAAMKATKKADMEDIAAKRFEDLSGTEPHDLLRAARAVAVGEAVGRFAFMASKDQSNPVNDLRTAASGSLLGRGEGRREGQKEELQHSCLGDPKLAQVAARVEVESKGAASLVAATSEGENLWLDHSSQEKDSRKRTRQEALGRNKDCPKLQCLCWKWAGETTAASACWDDDKAAKTPEGLPKTEFKCAVVMKGENVLAGIQALVDAGLMDAPLPDFVRDAPSLGGTIRVDHGSFAGTDHSQEERD